MLKEFDSKVAFALIIGKREEIDSGRSKLDCRWRRSIGLARERRRVRARWSGAGPKNFDDYTNRTDKPTPFARNFAAGFPM